VNFSWLETIILANLAFFTRGIFHYHGTLGDLLDKIVKHANVLHGFAIGLPKKGKP
jgi:hypothetical protein